MRRTLLTATLLLAFALTIGAWLGHLGLAASHELKAAQRSLSLSRSALLAQRNDDARVAMARAGRHTKEAVRRVDDPVFRVLSRIPVAGRSLLVARGVAHAADDVARRVLPATYAEATRLDPATVRSADGTIDVSALQRSGPRLDRLAARTARLANTTRALPRSAVVGVVNRGRDDFVAQVDQLALTLDRAAVTVSLAPQLLGADGPRSYFVLVQQTSESRGTGGLTGAFAVLRADHGRIRVTAEGSNAGLRQGNVPAPPGISRDYVDLYAGNGAFDLWPNVNLSPDLPTVAKVVAARWKQQSGQTVNGVVTVDAISMAQLLRGAGPISVGARRIGPDSLPEFLALGQYRGVAPFDEQASRKDELTTVSRAVTRRLTRGGGSSRELVRGLAAAITSGHLRLTTDNDEVNRQLGERLTGALPSGSGPLAYPVVFNSSGGKLDYFLDRAVTYSAAGCDGPRRRSRITVALRNHAPAGGLPPYVTIFSNAGRKQLSYDSAVTLSVYATRGARLSSATLDGQPLPSTGDGPHLSTAAEGGLPLWYAFLVLPRGKVRTLTLDLDEPVVAGAAIVPEQPLARRLRATVRVPTC